MPTAIQTLVLDDRESDADFLRGLLRQLTEHSFDITWESDPDRALAHLAQNPPDLVLLNSAMPGSNGLELLSKLRAAEPSLPVILLTGPENEWIGVEAMKRGAPACLCTDRLTAPALGCAILGALERRRLEAELAARRREADQNLQLARELQQAFLPQNFPHFAPTQRPDSMGLRFVHRYTPTVAVSGDFFDVLPLDDHTVGIFISDIAGHGLQAALVTSVLRTLLEEHREEAADVDGFLGKLNHSLHRILRQVRAPVYASAFYLKLDMREKRGAYANAGHPPQLLLRRRTLDLLRLFDASKAGPLLGLERNLDYPAHGFQIEPDDVFVAFTNGLLEVAAPDGTPFGINRLTAAAKQRFTAPPAQILEQILQAAGAHAGGEAFQDDICLMAVEAAAVFR